MSTFLQREYIKHETSLWNLRDPNLMVFEGRREIVIVCFKLLGWISIDIGSEKI